MLTYARVSTVVAYVCADLPSSKSVVGSVHVTLQPERRIRWDAVSLETNGQGVPGF